MSKLLLFSLFDRKAREYGPPLVAANAETMKRELRRNVQPESLVGRYPEDFDLYHLAYMDGDSGRLSFDDDHVILVDNLADILKEERNGAGPE